MKNRARRLKVSADTVYWHWCTIFCTWDR